ncbi:MAG: hypothetical protein ACE5HK_01725 [Candidatus Methylomirabilales bacterium]
MPQRIRILLITLLLLSMGCAPSREGEPRLSLFVGVDVSGSFTRSPHFKDALRFLSYYLYGHLHGIGRLERPRALFVGSIGGDAPNEPQAFYPIQEFERKSLAEIEAKLTELFKVPGRGNYLTDFNAYFKRIAEVVQKRNLALAPITIIIVSDGVPELAAEKGLTVVRAAYDRIDVSPLEYLARRVVVRILYPSPKVAAEWERKIPRQRVRIWPVEAEIMRGWREQLEERPRVEEEERLWAWIRDIVDHRVRRQRIL